MRFEEIISAIDKTDVTVYEKLNATNMQAAREEFLSDSALIHPNYIYGNLDPKEVSANLAILDTVEAELADNDAISSQQKLYANLILEDHRRANDFLAANIAYNAAKTPKAKAEATKFHHETNEAYFGKADEDTFYALLKEKLDKIHPENLRLQDQTIYKNILTAIGFIKPVQRRRFKPQPETIARFSKMIQDFFEDMLKHIPQNRETFTPDETVSIINEIIREEISYEKTNYRAKVHPERTGASVDPVTRSITLPGSRPKGNYNHNDLRAIIVHELGTHVYRAISYERHPLVALSRGLPGNEEWDEGVAKCAEQALAGRYEDSGVNHYINIGLATFKNKNFREVFDIGIMLKFLTETKFNETDVERSERLEKIRAANFNSVQRCFRGTGELVNNKDLAYYNGTNKVWKYIEDNIDDPHLLDHLFLEGKYVATDRVQSRLIHEIKTGAL